MKFSDDDIVTMIDQLDSICEAARKLEEQYEPQLSKVHPKFKKSALNLLHYIALRHQNILDLRLKLERLGVSMLDKILSSMEDYYRKKGFLLPELKSIDYLQIK